MSRIREILRVSFLLILFMVSVMSPAFASEGENDQVVDNKLYYTYSGYDMEITSVPGPAKIYINDVYEGVTPLTYKIEGDLPKSNLVIIDAVPVEKKYSFHPQSESVGGTSIIPGRLEFDLTLPSDYDE